LHVPIWNLSPNLTHPAPFGRAKKRASSAQFKSRPIVAFGVWLLALAPFGPTLTAPAQSATLRAPAKPIPQRASLPPRVAQAQRFLAQRGFAPGHRLVVRHSTPRVRTATTPAQTAATATWQPLGPTAVQTPDFGLVTGRVSALALDPSDATGNHLYLGTTGGGVWAAANAAGSRPSSIAFAPLTDAVNALGGAIDASISIGALTVQPGATGVILAGTGDPNDVLDSYYGAGILRSTDSGTTWTLIQSTQDKEDGLAAQDVSFVGEGFAGFAWSTPNPQLVVAAVSQAYEGTLVDADRAGSSYEGLYYSSDAGVTWHMATITDGSGQDVQGPLDIFAAPDGNAATAVVWNPLRRLFIAAVRFHGYYSSPDGITFTRMTAQPGSGLTPLFCPTNLGSTGSIDCPIFRGALAANPVTGDTFAWTVDLNNQDQGLWQDPCALSGSACGNAGITFARQLNTAALESSTNEGAVTISNGNYTLALAAVPSQQDTLVLAGGNDLWKCSLSMGCQWRNTTNSTTCMSAGVAEFQHAVAWNAANPLEIFIANDSGLWRSEDAIGESGPSCSLSDSTHFQNLNAGLGSLAEVVSLSPVLSTPYTIMAGLGVNGTAGVKNSALTADWPQILSGYGGPVAIDPANQDNWYVNAQSGVSIYRCSQTSPCTPADFGSSPVVTDADVNLQPGVMPVPAIFLVDPLDSTQLLIATCQLWRGPADGSGWTSSDSLTPILDSGATNAPCNGDALVRSMAAMKLPSGGEIIYLGTYGSANGGANLPGHVLSVTNNPSSGAAPSWSDLTLNPVVNDSNNLNFYGLDISSVFIDSHDTSGNTVYVTVAGIGSPSQQVEVVYRSTDGGAHWSDLTANLPDAPANSIAVDPQNANTVYLATDQGVYFTSQVANCTQLPYLCWSPFGTGLPDAPAVALSAAPASASAQLLVAATYGRGIWQTPLFTAGARLTTASALPTTLVFASQPLGNAGPSQTVTVENTGSIALTPVSIAVTAGFSEIDNCVNVSVSAAGSCSIQVSFVPAVAGSLTGQLIIYANIYGGQLAVDLDGTATAAGAISLTPSLISFGQVAVGSTSASLPVQAANSSSAAIPITSIAVTAPFEIAANSCPAASLPAGADCQFEIGFAPTQTGPASGTLTLTDGDGTQTVDLTGIGAAPPTDALSPTSLAFPATAVGQPSPSQNVTLSNTGSLPLTSISVSATSGFQFTNGCTTLLAAASSCTIAVKFVPIQSGAFTGTLTVADSLRTQTVALSGAGVAPAAFTINPSSLTFTNQQPGVPSSPQALTITNSGGAPMANIGFQITGPAAASYSLGVTTCGALLNNGAICTVQVIFTPSATGAIAALLAVTSSTAGVAAASIQLNGSGQLATGLGSSPSQLTFASVVGVGQSSSAQPLTITNSSSYSIANLTLSVTAPFTLSQNTCTASLAAGANCTAAVVFEPTTPGPASGALTLTSTSVASPVSVALSATGFDFSVTVTGLTGQTVSSGQTAVFPLVITPNGAQGTFTFACGTLPSNTLCSFNPATQTLPSGVQGNVNAEFSTGQSSSSARAEAPSGWRALPLLCGLLLLPLARARRRKIFLSALLAILLAAGVSSCTSSSGGTGGAPPGGGSGSTPAGTYTIPVTVTSTGVSHSVNLTLTVD
jgi:hypothetical protein